MKLTRLEIQVLEWAIENLIERAEKIERLTRLERSSYRDEAEVIRGIIERGENETEEVD